MASRRISVIIPTKDRPEELAKCLESVLGQTLLPDEIVIVDASDNEAVSSYIESYLNRKPEVKFIRSEPGLTHQKNLGVEACSGNIVFILDDDVMLEKDFVTEILDVFDNDWERKVAGVCGKIITAKKHISWSLHSILIWAVKAVHKVIAVIFLLRKSGDGTFRASGFPSYPYVASDVKRVEFLPGGLTAWRREVLTEFKFDEKLQGPPTLEDDDFSYRVSRKYVNIYTPHAKLFHYVSRVARVNATVRAKLTIQNRYYLFKKNLPQNLKHKLAFYWAVIGLFLQAIVAWDTKSLKGLIAGLLETIQHFDEFNTRRAM